MKYRLFILAAAALFSTGGAAIKATTFTNWQVAAFRSGIATLAILAFIPTARHVGDRRIWLTGIAYAVTLIAFVTATKLTTAANAIFLEDSAPLFLVLAGPWLLKEKVKAHDLAILAIMGCGLALFFAGAQPGSRTAPEPMRGNLLGLVSGAGWAATIAGLRILESRPHGQSPGLAMVAVGNTIACLVCLPFAFPVGQARTSDWLVVAYLGLIQIGLAYVLLTRAMRHVPALEASIFLLIEPVLNPLWAALIHDEWPHPYAVLGGGLILAATVLRLFRR